MKTHIRVSRQYLPVVSRIVGNRGRALFVDLTNSLL